MEIPELISLLKLHFSIQELIHIPEPVGAESSINYSNNVYKVRAFTIFVATDI